MDDNYVDRRIPLSPKERQPPAPPSVDAGKSVMLYGGHGAEPIYFIDLDHECE